MVVLLVDHSNRVELPTIPILNLSVFWIPNVQYYVDCYALAHCAKSMYFSLSYMINYCPHSQHAIKLFNATHSRLTQQAIKLLRRQNLILQCPSEGISFYR